MKRSLSIIFFFIFQTSFLYALDKIENENEILLDKIIAVVNDNVITLSEVRRLKETMDARKEISPMIYNDKMIDLSDFVDIKIKSIIIRDKISQQGFIISDEAVENRIRMTEQRLGLRRKDLINFLQSKGINYGEYFEIIRETMEFNVFTQRIISPLISLSQQELRSEFLKKNKNEKAFTYKYQLVDFSVKKENVTSSEQFSRKVKSFYSEEQLNLDKISTVKKDFNYQELNDVDLENLPSSLAKVLQNTSLLSFTKPLLIQNKWHIFFIKKADSVPSSRFLQQKDIIQNSLYMKKGESISQNWFEREYKNYFIKKFISL